MKEKKKRVIYCFPIQLMLHYFSKPSYKFCMNLLALSISENCFEKRNCGYAYFFSYMVLSPAFRIETKKNYMQQEKSSMIIVKELIVLISVRIMSWFSLGGRLVLFFSFLWIFSFSIKKKYEKHVTKIN